MHDIRARLRIFLGLTLAVLAGGTAGFMYLEKLSLWDALYFCLVTVTTVGYGDIHPTGPAGKMLAVVVILSGIGAFTGVVANATELLLSRHERAMMKQKMEMVRSLFFSEMGCRLLARFAAADPDRLEMARELAIGGDWDQARFDQVRAKLKDFRFRLQPDRLNGPELLAFLSARGDFLLRLLENPNLAAQAGFTDALRAVFHLRDELEHRRELFPVPENDLAHLAGDAGRAYQRLTGQWLTYTQHLKSNFPYLYSLAVRTNPFLEDSSPTVD